MCGIVGVVSACSNGFSNKEMNMFAGLLFMDTLRGVDSTGVFGVHNNENLVLHKDAVNGLDFLRTKEFGEFKTEMIQSGKFVVGHNRAATRGTVVDKNAHPFCVDDKIVLVQNGTYRGSHKHLKDTEVDTEAVAHVISETPDLTDALKKINASYALVWYNVDTTTLNIIRNHERPMYIAKFNDTGLIFASEASMIKFVAAREEVVISEPEAVPVHTHVALTLDKKGGYTRVDTQLEVSNTFQHPYEDIWGGRHHTHAVAYHHSPQTNRRSRIGLGADDVKYPFIELLTQKKAREYAFPTMEKALAEAERVKAASFQGHHYIEMIDYEPANDHINCTAWHLYGTVVSDADPGGPCTLVHWLEYSKDEAEVMEMVTSNFYKVKLGTIINRKIPVGNEEYGFVCTVYASTHEILQGLPTA